MNFLMIIKTYKDEKYTCNLDPNPNCFFVGL